MTDQDMQEQSTRISDLLTAMGSQRHVLEQILDFCRSRRPVAGVNAWVEQFQGPRAVFDAPALCRLLEERGALERTTETKSDAGATEGFKQAGFVCELSDERRGDAYLRPLGHRTSYWSTTPAGIFYLDSLKSKDVRASLAGDEPELWPVYEELLKFAGEGVTQEEVLGHLNSFPPYRKVREKVATAHLIDQARNAGALEWENGWRLTDAGRQALG